MNNRTPPELFAEPPVRSEYVQKRRRRLPRRLIRLVLLTFLLGNGVVWASFWAFDSGDGQAPAEIPTIKAEGSTKQRPEQPGGIDIPHQNETVFQQIDSTATGKQPAVEHLLPPPEVPASIAPQTATPAMAAPSASPVQPVTAVLPKTQSLASLTTTPSQRVEKLEAPAAVASQEAAKTETSAVLTETPKGDASVPAKDAAKAVTPAASVAATATKTATATGSLPKEMFTGETATKNFLVQLGSFPDQLTAQNEMKKIQKKYADTLGSSKLKLTKADLGRKGTYYRLQAGPMSDAQARSICATLWSQKAPCIVVRP